MEAIAIVTALALLQAFLFAYYVSKARGRYGVKAPAISGDPAFDAVFRVHQNTLEQLILLIPAMWIFGYYVHALIAAGLGLVFVISRFIYRSAYVRDPGTRAMGAMLGGFATVTLMLGGLVGAALQWLRTF